MSKFPEVRVDLDLVLEMGCLWEDCDGSVMFSDIPSATPELEETCSECNQHYSQAPVEWEVVPIEDTRTKPERF